MYLLGIDVGSSSVKVAIVRAKDGAVMSLVQHPSVEMNIMSVAPGYAEQDPEMWWQNTQTAIGNALAQSGVDGKEIQSIGISYQMHGLVVVDKNQNVLRPSIIWCDSRAVEIGNNAFSELGEKFCLDNYLNSPGNFTASKLRWVKENEPDIYAKIDKIMLPGDFINMKLTGEINTSISGLSEGIFWNFKENRLATKLMDHYEIDEQIIAEYLPSMSDQGTIKKEVAEKLHLNPNIKVTYRAGDQANNALSLGVLEPNEVAATGGTSGVIYGVIDQYATDELSRVNNFAHVNHTDDEKRLGVLLCINGAGSQYAWIKNQIANNGIDYTEIEKEVAKIPVGSEGLRLIPFGNGAERMLNNKNKGATLTNLQFYRHKREHIYRAALEGIAFSFAYGFELLKNFGLDPSVIKVGNDNLFRSQVFSETVATLLDTTIEVMDTSGAVGAAKASGIEIGIYADSQEFAHMITAERTITPHHNKEPYVNAYLDWKVEVDQIK